MISSKSRNNYKKKLKSSFRMLLGVLLPTSNSDHINPMRYSSLPFCFTGSLTNFKRKARDLYEAENENPLWSSTGFTTMLRIS